jgi:hypothetical protein
MRMKLIPATYTADFVVFGSRVWRSYRRTYTHAYAALRNPGASEWVWETDFYIGFSGSRELAEQQVRKRRNKGWVGPFEIVEVTASWE